MAIKRKYVPDLARIMAEGEANYRRLMKLLPSLEEGASYRYGLHLPDGHQGEISLRVTDSFAYTTAIEVEQSLGSSPWLKAPRLHVRLYHDARIAEVIAPKGRMLSGVYVYPNPGMKAPDEKAQLNTFLAEWLNHCIDYGLSPERVDVIRL
ncbi:DUF1249 domain-containing protein [Pokkaliibacter sp. CJK22405]|uniref:DUF1249 domain-containing protein n=1 Tax=Pokkaliibacter sp. CJK22405 TaxID=3384615 RepID=UPI0039850EA7